MMSRYAFLRATKGIAKPGPSPISHRCLHPECLAGSFSPLVTRRSPVDVCFGSPHCDAPNVPIAHRSQSQPWATATYYFQAESITLPQFWTMGPRSKPDRGLHRGTGTAGACRNWNRVLTASSRAHSFARTPMGSPKPAKLAFVFTSVDSSRVVSVGIPPSQAVCERPVTGFSVPSQG
jgi:hypothetical protein